MIKYIVVCSTYTDGENTRKSFGIAVLEKSEDGTAVLRSIADISSNEAEIERLVQNCNDLALDPVHLDDVVYDHIALV